MFEAIVALVIILILVFIPAGVLAYWIWGNSSS